MMKKLLIISIVVLALVGVFLFSPSANATPVQMRFNIENVGIGVGDSLSAILIKPTGSDWSLYSQFSAPQVGNITCHEWAYNPSVLPLPEKNCASVLGIEPNQFFNLRVERLNKNGGVVSGTGGNGIVITPHTTGNDPYYEASVSSYGGTTRFEIRPILVTITNPNCSGPGCSSTRIKGVRIKLVSRNSNDISSLDGTYAYKFIFSNHAYVWKAQGGGVTVASHQDLDASIIVRINEFHTDTSYACVVAGNTFDVSMLYNGIEKGMFWPTSGTLSGSTRRWLNGYFDANAPSSIISSVSYPGSQKVRFSTPSFSSVQPRTGVVHIGYNPMGDWNYGYDLFYDKINLTVVPTGASCGNLVISGPSVIELEEGTTAGATFSTNIGTAATKWSSYWQGYAPIPGVKITSPVPSAQFIGGPGCNSGNTPPSSVNLSFIRGFFADMFSLIIPAHAAELCWIYNDPTGLSMNLSVDARGVSGLSAPIEKRVFIQATDSWNGTKGVIVRILPKPAIAISGDPTLPTIVGQIGSKPYTANVTGSLQGNVRWSLRSVPSVFGQYGISININPQNGTMTNLTADARTPLQPIPASGIREAVELQAEDSADADPYARMTVFVSVDPVSTSTLSASLSATPTSGVAPLTISATAQAQGTATGNINYTFYCNRSDAGTNVTMPYDHKLDNTTQNPYTRSNICTYSTPGTYTLKVIIERGSAVAQAQQTITVSSSTGPNFTLNVLPSEIVITRPTSGTAASTTLIFINGFSGFNSGLPTHANSAQFTVPSIRLQDGPDRSPSPSFGGWLISGINTVFAGIGTFTVSPTTELGTSTYMVRVTGTGLNGTVTKDVSVPVRVVAGPGGGGVADFALNPPNPNPLIIVRPTSGTLASSSSVLANNFTGFNPSVPNSNLVNCTSRLSRLSASLEESPIGATLPTPSPGAWSGSGGTGGLSSSCTSAMAFSIRSNTTPGIYTYRLSTIGTPPSGSALSKNTTQTVIVVPQGVSDVLSILPPRQTLVRPPAGSVSETMFNAVVSRVSGGYATINYKPYTITSPQYQGITVNPNYIYPDFPSSSGIEGPSGINFQDGSTINPSFLYETDLRGGVTWTHTQTGLGSISYRLIQNGSQATVQFDRDQGISTVTRGELTLTARTGSGISRSVQIPVTVSPMGQQLNPILVSITSGVPTTTRIIDIRSTVNPALQASFQLAILATSTTSTSTLPQCSDGIDNNDPEDSDADGSDPGCHTDFNPNNIASYDPNDNDETNTPSYTLRILPPKDITATSPIPTSVSFPIRVVRQQGFNGSVQLLFQPSGSLPTGVTYSFSPATLSSSQTNSTLTISAASSTILSLMPPRVDQQILFTVRGESSLTNEGSDSGSVTFAYSNDGCGCSYTSGIRFRDGKILLGWNCNDIDPTDRVELYRTYATYVSPPGITTFNNSNETGPISLAKGYDNDPGATTPSNNTIKAVRYQLKCIQGNTTIPPTVNPNRDIIRKVFAPFGATILEQ